MGLCQTVRATSNNGAFFFLVAVVHYVLAGLLSSAISRQRIYQAVSVGQSRRWRGATAGRHISA